jgi:hypothetical protein
METVMSQLEAFSLRLPGGTEESHDKTQVV